MKKTGINFLVDSALLILLASVLITGVVLWILPGGPEMRELRWFIIDIHKWLGLALALLGIYHLYLHWNMYMKMFRDYNRIKH